MLTSSGVPWALVVSIKSTWDSSSGIVSVVKDSDRLAFRNSSATTPLGLRPCCTKRKKLLRTFAATLLRIGVQCSGGLKGTSCFSPTSAGTGVEGAHSCSDSSSSAWVSGSVASSLLGSVAGSVATSVPRTVASLGALVMQSTVLTSPLLSSSSSDELESCSVVMMESGSSSAVACAAVAVAEAVVVAVAAVAVTDVVSTAQHSCSVPSSSFCASFCISLCSSSCSRFGSSLCSWCWCSVCIWSCSWLGSSGC